MRTKDEILDNARQDITSPQYGDTAHLWLDVRKIEVLIDIRDELSRIQLSLLRIVMSLKNKD